MSVLLSAYACEPGKGSEPGVGWNWACTLAELGHEVHLITRSNNRFVIARELARLGVPITASYCDLPPWAIWWKRHGSGIYIYYLLWQVQAYLHARRLLKRRSFDRAHHVTFASFRQPTFMWGLGIPLLFGPVGGGETMPAALRRGLPWMGRLREKLRDIGNAAVKFDPLMHLTFSRAVRIACTTEETLHRIPQRYRHKCIVQPTIGVEAVADQCADSNPLRPPSFLYIGRLLYWKGIHLILRALAVVKLHAPEVTLKIIGDGPDSGWLRKVANECGVHSIVHWAPWMAHDVILKEYRSHTAFLFPSMHDSGGMVVLEALSAGCPVICLKAGGPGSIITPSCGVAISPDNRSEDEIVHALSDAMLRLIRDPKNRDELASQCVARANEYRWRTIVTRLYPDQLPGL